MKYILDKTNHKYIEVDVEEDQKIALEELNRLTEDRFYIEELWSKYGWQGRDKFHGFIESRFLIFYSKSKLDLYLRINKKDD